MRKSRTPSRPSAASRTLVAFEGKGLLQKAAEAGAVVDEEDGGVIVGVGSGRSGDLSGSDGRPNMGCASSRAR